MPTNIVPVGTSGMTWTRTHGGRGESEESGAGTSDADSREYSLRGRRSTSVFGSETSRSLSNLNARINAHWKRGKQRDQRDTRRCGAARRAIIVSRPLNASIGTGHMRRKLTR